MTVASLDTRLERALSRPDPDRSPIWEWAARNISLPENYTISGPYNAKLSPWSIPIFEALTNDRTRVVSFIKCIQDAGGTLISDIWIPWIIANRPGPISFTLHSEDMVKLHSKMRLMPLLERGCPAVAQLLPRPGPMRGTEEIHFGGFSLILNSANLTDQQSQSIRYKINDEVWHPKWRDIYADAVGRVSAFERVGLSKIFNISQGGFEGDIADKVWRDGSQEEWGAECKSCGKWHPLQFAVREKTPSGDGALLGGVVWDTAAKSDDGHWNVEQAKASARFRCPHCKTEQPDADTTREHWRRTGRFITEKVGAGEENRSFHVESVVARPMRLLVEEFLNARNELLDTGDESSLIKFRQKREARSWKVSKTAVNLFTSQETKYAVADFEAGKTVPGEVFRGAAIDRQQDHFWMEVGAVAAGPEYWHLWFGRCDTEEQCAAVLERYGVKPNRVVMDRRYKPALTDAACLRFGWRGMEGYARKTWTLADETSGEMANFPHSDPKWANLHGQEVPYYQFSSGHMKDIIANALGGRGFKWRLPSDVNPVYLEHVQAEAKQPDGSWREVKVNAPNHGLDTSSMMLAMLTVAGIFKR